MSRQAVSLSGRALSIVISFDAGDKSDNHYDPQFPEDVAEEMEMLRPKFGRLGVVPPVKDLSSPGSRATSVGVVAALHAGILLLALFHTRVIPIPVELPLQVAMVETEHPPEMDIPPMPTFQPALALSQPVTLPMPQVVVASTQPSPIPAQPTAITPPAAAPAGSPEQASKRQEGLPPDYLALLMTHLGKAKRYPQVSRRLRQQGIVHVRFVMSRTGRIVSASLDRPCEHEALNAEAVALLYRAMPLPRLPDDMPDLVELVIPVEFFLR